jgi:hypothetical protein
MVDGNSREESEPGSIDLRQKPPTLIHLESPRPGAYFIKKLQLAELQNCKLQNACIGRALLWVSMAMTNARVLQFAILQFCKLQFFYEIGPCPSWREVDKGCGFLVLNPHVSTRLFGREVAILLWNRPQDTSQWRGGTAEYGSGATIKAERKKTNRRR